MKKLIKKIEERGENVSYILFYFLIIIFIRNFFESLLEEKHIFLFSSDLYTSFIINVHFLFFYLSILIGFLFLTKIFINKKTNQILSILVFGFTITLIVPFVDFIFSAGKGYDLSYPFETSLSLRDYLIKAFNPLGKFPGTSPGIRIEIITMLILVFFYIKYSTKNLLKSIIVPLFFLFFVLFSGLIPLYLYVKLPEFWKGGILPIDSQKFGAIYGFLFFIILSLFLIFFENKIFNLFYNIIFSNILNLLLPFAGLIFSYYVFAYDFEFTFKTLSDYLLFVPFFLSLIFYSITENKFFMLTFILSIFYAVLLSSHHFFLLLFLYCLVFLQRTYLNQKISLLLVSPFKYLFLFIYGYLVFTKEMIFYLIDKKLIIILFILSILYSLFLYYTKNKKKKITIDILFFISIVTILFFFKDLKINNREAFQINYLLHKGRFKEANLIYKKYKPNKKFLEPLFFLYSGKREEYIYLFDKLKSKKEIIEWAENVKNDKKFYSFIYKKRFLYPYAYFFLKYFHKKSDLKNLILAYKFGFDSPVLFAEIANHYLKSNKIDKAYQFIEKGLRENYSPLLEMIKYIIFAKQGKIDEAEKGFLSLINKGYKNEIIYNNLGVIYMNKGFYKKALLYFQKALLLNPDYKSALKNIEILKSKVFK